MKFRSFSQFISPRPTLWAGTSRYIKTNFFLVTQIIPNYCNGVYFSHTWKTRSTVPQRKKYLSRDFCLQKTSAFYDSVIEQNLTTKLQFLQHPILKSARAWPRGQEKILTESIWYVGFCSPWCFGSSCLVTVWVLKPLLLLNTEAGTRTNCSI